VAAARKATVLLALDPAELDAFDRYWRAAGFPSRRQAIRHALEVRVAEHHAHQAAGRRADAEPQGRWLPARTSPDTAAAERSRPITADLAEHA
jgi:hypothetical protein